MKPLDQLAHLLSTDQVFRQAFLDNPDMAIAGRGWSLDAETKEALASVRKLLATSPRELAGRLSHAANIYGSWGGFTLEDVLPATQPL